MKPITCGALCELSNNVVEKLASKYSNVEKEVTEVMGGKVLNYRSKEIYLEGCAFGREEGREEGRKLGREEGREEERKEFLQKICSLIQKKLEKGKTISEIADDLEDTEENISHLIEQFHLGRKES